MASVVEQSVKVAIVTNIPAPYRLKVYEALAAEPGLHLRVMYCSGREPDRAWDLAEARYDAVYLKERFLTVAGRFVHVNPDVWGALNRFKPDVVITTGYNPTHLLAFAHALAHGARHVVMTDGTWDSELKLSALHRLVRRVVFARSRAFIGASDGARTLFEHYGIGAEKFFKSHLCADNAAFAAHPPVPKRFDFIYCGRFTAVKNPLFALQVAQGVARRLGRPVSIALVGSGEMEPAMREMAGGMAHEVHATFGGFAKQAELPGWYLASRVLLFPTSWDPWGVVANEACAAGLPVLVTAQAGVAGEIVRHEDNGLILPLRLDDWIEAACRLLGDVTLYERMSARSRALVADYNYANAAQGIVQAVRLACAPRPRSG